MARALMGHVGTPKEHALAYEVARLRRRVAQLESELADVRAAAHTDPIVLDLELHRIAEASEPALA